MLCRQRDWDNMFKNSPKTTLWHIRHSASLPLPLENHGPRCSIVDLKWSFWVFEAQNTIGESDWFGSVRDFCQFYKSQCFFFGFCFTIYPVCNDVGILCVCMCTPFHPLHSALEDYMRLNGFSVWINLPCVVACRRIVMEVIQPEHHRLTRWPTRAEGMPAAL